MNTAADLWKRVQFGSSDDCWPFDGALTTKGYGQFFFDGQRHAAHRVAYELARACCNPAHLEVVTSRENTLRGEGIAAARSQATHCGNGHEFTEDNTLFHGPDRRWRLCRTCKRRDRAAYRARLKTTAEHTPGGRTEASTPAHTTAPHPTKELHRV